MSLSPIGRLNLKEQLMHLLYGCMPKYMQPNIHYKKKKKKKKKHAFSDDSDVSLWHVRNS
jgi:hypothetical protein